MHGGILSRLVRVANLSEFELLFESRQLGACRAFKVREHSCTLQRSSWMQYVCWGLLADRFFEAFFDGHERRGKMAWSATSAGVAIVEDGKLRAMLT